MHGLSSDSVPVAFSSHRKSSLRKSSFDEEEKYPVPASLAALSHSKHVRFAPSVSSSAPYRSLEESPPTQNVRRQPYLTVDLARDFGLERSDAASVVVEAQSQSAALLVNASVPISSANLPSVTSRSLDPRNIHSQLTQPLLSHPATNIENDEKKENLAEEYKLTEGEICKLRGDKLLKEKKYLEAQKCYETAIRVGEDGQAMFQLSEMYAQGLAVPSRLEKLKFGLQKSKVFSLAPHYLP